MTIAELASTMEKMSEKYEIFRIGISRTDYQTGFTAKAEMRGASWEVNAWGETISDAMVELDKRLKAMHCPHCGRRQDV